MTITNHEQEPVVSVRAVSRTIGQHVILDACSFDVARGEVVVIIGPSGAGKTTLLRTINHLEPIDSGEVLVAGVHVGYRVKNGVLVEGGARFVTISQKGYDEAEEEQNRHAASG